MSLSAPTIDFDAVCGEKVDRICCNPYVPHVPTDKQIAFLMDLRTEVLFGGSAGGGKSDALLMAALMYVDVPGYSALLLRRTFTDLSLPGALMDRCADWLRNTDAKWDDKGHTWRFPSGATITFGYLEGAKDHERYQGAHFQFVGFDELTQFLQPQYSYLHSRLRRLEGSTVPIRMRGASNPGGVGHTWVRLHFITSDDPTRRYLPAGLDDNPYLDQDAYRQQLDRLDPVTRAQLRDGDWNVTRATGMFRRASFKLVATAPTSGSWVRFWDLASTAPEAGKNPDRTAGVLMGIYDQQLWIADMAVLQAGPGGVQALVKRTAKADVLLRPSVQCRMEQEPGSAGKTVIYHYGRRVLGGYDFRGVRSSGNKVVRAQPFAADVFNGFVSVVEAPWVPSFFEELEIFDEGEHDDQVDACSGAYCCLRQRWDLVREEIGITLPEHADGWEMGRASVEEAHSVRGWD